MATNAPQDDWHKTGLRLPKDLHSALHDAAAATGRSYNAEIVARLQQSFEGSEIDLRPRLSAHHTKLADRLLVIQSQLTDVIRKQDFIRDQILLVDDEEPGGERQRAEMKAELSRLWLQRAKLEQEIELVEDEFAGPPEKPEARVPPASSPPPPSRRKKGGPPLIIE